MIPKVKNDFDNIKIKEETSKTFKVDFNNEKTIGDIDNIEAIKQTVFLILHTERYKSLIHSWNYGVELEDLFGKSNFYVLPELKRRIKEALTQDDRILDVDAFNFDTKIKGKIHVKFTVQTIFGDIEAEKVVTV